MAIHLVGPWPDVGGPGDEPRLPLQYELFHDTVAMETPEILTVETRVDV